MRRELKGRMAEWILPANRRYRAYDALRDLKRIEWVQNSKLDNAAVGDAAYIYECAPVKAVRWKCRITAVNRQASMIDDSAYNDDPVRYPGPYMEIEAVYEYLFYHQLSLDALRKSGYKGNMQGPCLASSYPGLARYLHAVGNIQTSETGLAGLCAQTPLHELKKLAEAHAQEHPAVEQWAAKRYARSLLVGAHAKRRADGICELCGQPAPFPDRYGQPYLEAHHVQWLSQGGGDTPDNTVALCPNCHRRMHIVNDPRDVAALRKILGK